MNKLFLSILLLTAFSCKQKDVERKRHEKLLDFKSSTVMSVDEIILADTAYMGNIYSQNFYTKTDTVEYRDKYIYISYLSVVNGCADYDGNLEFKSDSIILKLDNISGIECTEIRCDRLVYKIRNPENKRYKIKKF